MGLTGALGMAVTVILRVAGGGGGRASYMATAHFTRSDWNDACHTFHTDQINVKIFKTFMKIWWSVD